MEDTVMRKSFIVPVIILALSTFFAACESMDSGKPGATDAKVRMTDTEIENAVKAKWTTDAALKGFSLSIDADADKNTATVSGDVATEAQRTKAIELAKSAHSGLLITDKIDVKPREVSRSEYNEELARSERAKATGAGEKIGDSLDDAWVHTKIVAQLVTDADTPQRKINVDVVNNIVTLRGAVNTAEQKAEAERIAKTTEGVKKVVNLLKVDKSA
jgi:osmotically-inducible protein OsmY